MYVFLFLNFLNFSSISNKNYPTSTEALASPSSIQKINISPLASFSSVWDDRKYDIANSAKDAIYMNEKEREVILILNLVRMDPVLFEKTVLKQYPEYINKPSMRKSSYYNSLSATLKKLQPLNILLPNRACFESAQCHAISSGKSSYLGHARITEDCMKITFYMGECISYGYQNPLDIVMALLIDEGVPSLGHRKNFLGNFKSAGVAIQPHKSYRFNAVIDLAH
jgi:uncharacterized protein YkwD